MFFITAHIPCIIAYTEGLTALNLFNELTSSDALEYTAIACTFFLVNAASIGVLRKQIENLFLVKIKATNHQQQKNAIMNTATNPNVVYQQERSGSSRLLWKGILTAGLILAMMIPMVIVGNLVSEREERQKEVVKEVSSKWAAEQRLSGPFLSVPYKETTTDSKGKAITITTPMFIIPAESNAKADIAMEERERSIFKAVSYTHLTLPTICSV